jgi:hypothetical protein
LKDPKDGFLWLKEQSGLPPASYPFSGRRRLEPDLNLCFGISAGEMYRGVRRWSREL